MFVPLKTSRFVRGKLPTQLILPPLPHQFCDNSRKNWRLSNPIRYEIGNKKWPWCWVTVSGDHRIGPKSWKMAIIMSRRRGGTWAGVPVATWWSEWICRMRGGLVHHTIMIPAVWSLPLLRGACSMCYLCYMYLSRCCEVHRQYFKMTGLVPESQIFSSLQFFRLWEQFEYNK